jgi:DNA-binding PadR family transcriptional regulator
MTHTLAAMDEAEIHRHLPLNPRDYLVLYALTGGPSHGYGLVKDVERQSRGLVRLDPSNLYRSLKRLIQQGLVEERERERTRQSGGERRRFYGITSLGRKVVAAEAERLSRLTDAARASRLIPEPERPR